MTDTIEIKQQVKEALSEFFSDDNDYLRSIVSELMEEIALGKAMEEGDVGDYVDEQLIYKCFS
ncbi:MAG: hypothetical protein WCR42_06830 [bacterium]